MFKFLGHTQFLEVCTTSKEIMLFHDNGFVLLRSPLVALYHDGMVDGKGGCIC
jgi:hypothetical protein